MSTILENETLLGLADMLKVAPDSFSKELNQIVETNHRYLKDLKINLSNGLSYPNLTKKESYLLALSVAVNDKSERLKNLKGCFSANSELVKNRNIILIDDVITTGTTMNEATKTLREAGAKKVIGFSLAH